MSLYTVREWERIGYGAGEGEIPEAHADRLAAVARSSDFAGSDGGGVLEHGRKGLRARGVVGVVATRDCQLEILPKIEAATESDVADASLRQRLVHMLAVVHDLRIDTGVMTRLGWQRDTVLEILVRVFCARLTDAVRQGRPQRYLAHEEDLPALRGRLDVMRQFSTRAAAPQRLACRFDALSPDIELNQVMRATVTRLARLARAPDNQATLRALNFAYADVTEVPVSALGWDRIILDRANRRWRDLLSLARLFLSGRHQRTSAGAVEGHALLFEMGALFEQYVARILSAAAAGTGLSVSAQGGNRPCLYDERGRGLFHTRPDLIIRRGRDVELVIDTKWKRMTRRVDDPKRGVSQPDVYQLMAYGRLYGCRSVMLLYPHHGGLGAGRVCERHAIGSQDAGESLHVATLDIAGGSAREHGEAVAHLVERCLALDAVHPDRGDRRRERRPHPRPPMRISPDGRDRPSEGA